MIRMALFNPCFLNLILLTASIYGTLSLYDNIRSNLVTDTFKTLDQHQMYDIVNRELVNIYIKSYMFALIPAILFAIYMHINNKCFNSCIFTLIIKVVTIFIYMYHPKKYNIVPYLRTIEQKEAYNLHNKEIKESYILGLLIGAGIYLIISRY